MYDIKSLKAEEFISDEEILDTLAYADANKDNVELIDTILAKAREKKGLNHREASVLLACQMAGLNIYEYTPLQVKQAVAGYGRAEKAQVMEMVRRICKLSSAPKPDDAADAVALAICHARSSTSLLYRGDREECSTI